MRYSLSVTKALSNGEKTIDYRFKILYALGMIFIVAGHCRNGGISLAYEWFPPYAFHLGLFVFASGYFYSYASEEHPYKYILKKIKSLLIPLYLWNFFYAIFITFLRFYNFDISESVPVSFKSLFLLPITNGHQFMFNMGGWFVIPLFIIQVFNVLARSLLSRIKFKTNEWVWFFINMLIGIGGVWIASQGYNEGLWLVLVRVLYFVPFYALGTLYRQKLEKKDKCPNLPYFATIFIIQLAIITIYKKAPYYIPSWCKTFTDGPLLPFVVGFLGIAFWLRVSAVLTPTLKNSKAVMLIANNTFSIMINQFLGFWLVNVGFWALNKVFSLTSPVFDHAAFKTSVWFRYLPNDMNHWLIIYLAAGIIVPIVMQVCFLDKAKKYISLLFNHIQKKVIKNKKVQSDI